MENEYLINPSENFSINEENKEKASEDNNILKDIEEVGEDKGKKRLIDALEKIKAKLQDRNKKTIQEVYITYSQEQFLENKKVKKGKYNTFSRMFYKLLLLLITTFYLTGSFVLVCLKKSLWNLFFTSVKCYFECDKDEFKKQSNFFEYFHGKLLREPFDLNLMMFWNFIGVSLSNLWGFRIASLFFLGINVLIIILTFSISYAEYDEETCKYSIPKIILLFFTWAFMAISFGGSSLLAQQKLIDYYSLLDEINEINENESEDNNEEIEEIEMSQRIATSEEDKENNSNGTSLLDDNKDGEKVSTIDKAKKQKEKIKKHNFDSLILFILASVLGYLGKYGISIGFFYYKEKITKTNNDTNYNNTNISSNIINNHFYFGNYSNNNNSDIIDVNELNQTIFLFINIIYVLCILISIILYSFLMCCYFKKIKKKSQNQVHAAYGIKFVKYVGAFVIAKG